MILGSNSAHMNYPLFMYYALVDHGHELGFIKSLSGEALRTGRTTHRCRIPCTAPGLISAFPVCGPLVRNMGRIIGTDGETDAAPAAVGGMNKGNGADGIDGFSGQKPCGAGSRCLRLGNGFIDGFGIMGQTAEKYPVHRKIRWRQLDMGFGKKPFVIDRHLEKLGQFFIPVGNHGGRQRQQIGPKGDGPVSEYDP